ncbi:MAG TPA: hypothetical protein VJ045_07210 [Hyphomicrobiaceae bacterium]|nr:hypothetical protein [Hyphomicrobiaceae bacterium]
MAALLMATSPAEAYLDPGTGSFVLQMLLAGALAVGASIKLFWHRIKELWRTVLGHEKSARDTR